MGSDEKPWVYIVVRGQVVPKERPRFYKGRTYTGKRTTTYESLVRSLMVAERPKGWPMDARYAVGITINPRDARRFDVDNAAKSILDAGNGALWRDDSSVDDLHVIRSANKWGADAHVTITVSVL